MTAKQEQKKVEASLQITTQDKIFFTYFIQPVGGISPNLGKALSQTTSNGGRQINGTLHENDLVSWTNDKRVMLHHNLVKVVGSPQVAKFQTTKLPNEGLPRIYVAGLEQEILISTLKYILASNPATQQLLLAQIVSDFVVTPTSYRNFFSGKISKLNRMLKPNSSK